MCNKIASAVQMGCWFVLNLFGAYSLPTALLAAREYLAVCAEQPLVRHAALGAFVAAIVAASVAVFLDIINKNWFRQKKEG